MSSSKLVALVVSSVPLLLCFAGCGDDGSPPDDHGSIKIQLVERDDNSGTFAGTKGIMVRVQYGNDCLSPFYSEIQPSWGDKGIDGEPVFAAWMDRLCDPGEFSDIVDCEVISISQGENAATNQPYLQVQYRILDDDLVQKQIRVGPLPTEALAECFPAVKINTNGVLGYEDEALQQQVWRSDTLSHTGSSTGEGAPIVAKVDRTDDED